MLGARPDIFVVYATFASGETLARITFKGQRFWSKGLIPAAFLTYTASLPASTRAMCVRLSGYLLRHDAGHQLTGHQSRPPARTLLAGFIGPSHADLG